MNRLRCGPLKREHGVCRTIRYDANGQVQDVREQTPAQYDRMQHTLRAIDKMNTEEKQQFLKQLRREIE